MGRRVGSTSTCFVLTFLSWFRGAAARYDSCTTGTITDIGNGRCDAALNVPSCGFDGGDCCPCTCSDGPDHSCSDNTFDCEYLDCDASGISSDFEWDDTPECEEDDDQTDRTGTFGPLGKTFSAREGEGTACCEKNYIADGYCDSVNNHIGCSWDGGDVSLSCSELHAIGFLMVTRRVEHDIQAHSLRFFRQPNVAGRRLLCGSQQGNALQRARYVGSQHSILLSSIHWLPRCPPVSSPIPRCCLLLLLLNLVLRVYL